MAGCLFNVARGIRVKLIGESGVDGGGPRREFYRLLVEAVCSTSGLLEGSDRKKIPLHNCPALKAKKFFLLGVMAGMSMLDGGPGTYACLVMRGCLPHFRNHPNMSPE